MYTKDELESMIATEQMSINAIMQVVQNHQTSIGIHTGRIEVYRKLLEILNQPESTDDPSPSTESPSENNSKGRLGTDLATDTVTK